MICKQSFRTLLAMEVFPLYIETVRRLYIFIPRS